MWVNNDCPCTRDCPDRWVAVDGSTPRTCHCSCERYEKWAKKREEDKKAHAIRKEGTAMTHAQKKALWASRRRDQYGKCTKKFTG